MDPEPIAGQRLQVRRLTAAPAQPTSPPMTALQFPQGLSEIASRYDTILCDVWGVIHNGRSAFTDACDALDVS